MADGISRKFVNMPKEQGDGHEWTVSKDWEACTRFANDVLHINATQLESTYSELRTRFADEKVFLEVINSMLELGHGKSLKVQKGAKHKAKGYMIEDGKLWRIGDRSGRARVRLECITKEETVKLAWEEHCNNGHFHRDNIKAKLLDTITSPKMDQSITKVILDCGKCKGFGTTHLHLLLEPITRRHPFELMAADMLSMPKEKRFHEAWTMDGHVCTAGVGNKAENICNGQNIPEKLWRHLRHIHSIRDSDDRWRT